MQFTHHHAGDHIVAELTPDSDPIPTASDLLDVIANAGARRIVVHGHQLPEEFFDLKTGLAGEMLQKTSNYGVRLGIIGDFGDVTSDSLRAFITESNRSGQIVFVPRVEDALARFGGR
tara:strand:- start:449 stop:802 length:354 start_codon:yes stop_codon:yes gene_type:complete